MKYKNDYQWRALLVLATMTALTALAGGIGSTDAPWLYVQLARPAWSPPAWVFAPAWTLLYVLMTLSAWLVVRARGWPAARPLMLLFAAQLLTNGLWSWLFFKWRLGVVAIGLALVAAAVVGYFYLSQDILNPNGGAPRLVFEIRLPAGVALPTDNERPIQLETSKNRMPALMDRAATRDDGGRPVLVGTVEMYYRTSSRLLTMTMPDKTDLIFNLKLGSAPKHSREFSPWQRAEYIADPGKDQPRRATPDDNYEIRYRTEWPGED